MKKNQHARRKHKGKIDENLESMQVPKLELSDGSLFNLYDNEKPDNWLILLGSI